MMLRILIRMIYAGLAGYSIVDTLFPEYRYYHLDPYRGMVASSSVTSIRDVQLFNHHAGWISVIVMLTFLSAKLIQSILRKRRERENFKLISQLITDGGLAT